MLQSRLGKVVFARLSEDDDLLEEITHVAKDRSIAAGFFVLIGTLKVANIGFYKEGKYKTIKIEGPLEIVSCMGNVSLKENEPIAHAHMAISNETGEVFGGHVMPGCIVAATGELVFVEAKDIKLLRKMDDKTKLFLWSLGK